VSIATLSARQVIEDYIKALAGHPKTEQTIDSFVDDLHLKQTSCRPKLAFRTATLFRYKLSLKEIWLP
jgi:hypothetical protein